MLFTHGRFFSSKAQDAQFEFQSLEATCSSRMLNYEKWLRAERRV